MMKWNKTSKVNSDNPIPVKEKKVKEKKIKEKPVKENKIKEKKTRERKVKVKERKVKEKKIKEKKPITIRIKAIPTKVKNIKDRIVKVISLKNIVSKAKKQKQKILNKIDKDELIHVKTPTVYQVETTESGAAALAMILAYYGCFVSLEQLRIETGVSRYGCKATNIIKAARKFGMECKRYTKSASELLNVPVPAIIHWNYNHFVVFEGFKGSHAYINDPAVGRRKLTMEELEDAFTGVVLCFEEGENFQKSESSFTLPTYIGERLKGQKSAVAALLCTGLLLVIPGLLIPVFSQIFIDNLFLGENSDWIGGLLVAMAATLLFRSLFTWYRGSVRMKLQSKLALMSAHEFLHKLFRLPIAFFEQRTTGDLLQRAANYNNVSNSPAGELAETLLNIFVACFYLILMFYYSPLLTVIGLAGVLFSLIIVCTISKKTASLFMKVQQDKGKMAGVVYSGLSITDSLKASGAENEYVSRILGHCAQNIRAEQKIGKTQQIISAIPQAASQVTGVVVLMVGGLLIMKGSITAGMLVAFTQLLGSLTDSLNQLMGFLNYIYTIKADMSRVEDIQKYEPAPEFLQEKIKLSNEKLSGKVEVKEVSFGYSPLAQPFIRNFSFQVQPGHSVALVGTSGCGKSTMTKIISGLYDTWNGEVMVDGIPLHQLSTEIISGNIAMVGQDIKLFSGTIRDNLTLWNENIAERDIVRAAKDACIHEVITKLPGAYDYRLLEGGRNLSGGQRQCLEIARALVLKPSILIMDEATGALDPIMEKKIMDNIKKRGCTCIIAAQRLSTIRDCDEILVMEKGAIIQRGTHEELKNQDGLYSQLISNE